MKCILIRCPQLLGKYVTSAPAVPPLGLAYVAAGLVAAGHEVEVVDTTGEAIDDYTEVGGGILRRGLSDRQILDRIERPDLIGFGLMFSQDWLVTRELIARVRAAHPGAVLVAGGEHFSAAPEEALREAPGLDFVVTGEGDQSIRDLAEHVDGRRSIDEVAGTYYRHAGGVRMSGNMVRVREVDALPRPAWDLVPVENYLRDRHGFGVDRGRSMPLLATRGCPYQCTFCSSPTMWTTRWSARSPDSVVAEMRAYVERYAATNFDLHDLTAILKRSWILDFARLLIREDMKITWQLPGGTRSEALDEEVLRLVRASGCANITYAPESGNPEVLKRIKKKVKTGRMLRSARGAVRVGCNVKANFIFGLPGDTLSSLYPTFGFLARLAVAGVHDVSIAPFRPYPGSELFRSLQEQGRIPRPLNDEFYRGLLATSESVPNPAMARGLSFTEGISPENLSRLRMLAFMWFYSISWLLRPIRIIRLVRALVTNRQESRLDKSLNEIRQRFLRSWRRRGPLGSAVLPLASETAAPPPSSASRS